MKIPRDFLDYTLVIIGSTHAEAHIKSTWGNGMSAVDFRVVTVHHVTTVTAKIQQSTACGKVLDECSLRVLSYREEPYLD